MKIIQLVQKPQLRGAEIFACQLSNHLLEKGHQVIVVSIFQGESELPFLGKIIHLNRPLSKRFYDIKAWKDFHRIIKNFNPDVIQANAADTLKFAASSRLIFSWKQPLVLRNANKAGDFIDSKIKLNINKIYLSQVAYVISVSRECEKDFIKTYNYPAQKISTVEIGVENKKIGEVPNDLLTVFRKGPTIVHIGSFVPEKNHEGLINIFSQIHKNLPDAQLLLIGKGKLIKDIRSKVEGLNLSMHVHFLEYRTDVLNILHHSDVFVLPSLIEGLPAVILEAMFCETPVVAYNVGGIGEVVMPQKTGWLVNKNDEETLKRCIVDALQNEQEVNRRIAAAKTMVSENFMNTIIAERFTDCYKSLLNQ